MGLTGYHMEASRIMITSITTKTAAETLVTTVLAGAWALERARSRGYARLETLPWVPAALWELCARLRAAGAALETFSEHAAEPLGIEMANDVLEPLLDSACRV